MAELAQSTHPKVSQLAQVIRRQLAELGDGWVEGELQHAKKAGSGHCYLTLADENAQLDGIIWRGNLARMKDLPEVGSLVQAHYEKIDFYPPRGATSLHIDEVRLTGVGELLRRRAETLKTLQQEGLTDPARKRPLPRFPRRVGVIAPLNSDAWVDATKSLRERFPPAGLTFIPALVEGIHAVDSIIEALARMQSEPEVDVILLARGGGGVRELVPFDDERLCRAIVASTIPVVTAVAHTQQRPNCDHVAAAYADVPRVAAELLLPSARELTEELGRHRERLGQIPAEIESRREQLAELASRARPTGMLQRRGESLGAICQRLDATTETFYVARRGQLDVARHKLAAIPPKLPSREALIVARQRLEGASGRFLAARAAELDRMATKLDFAPRRLRSKAVDYRHAFDRHGKEARRAVERQLKRRRELVRGAADEASRVAPQVLRRTADRIGHLLELVRAKDPRRRGWLMAADKAGQAVPRVAAVRNGQELILHFDDGHAEVTVDVAQKEQGEADV